VKNGKAINGHRLFAYTSSKKQQEGMLLRSLVGEVLLTDYKAHQLNPGNFSDNYSAFIQAYNQLLHTENITQFDFYAKKGSG